MLRIAVPNKGTLSDPASAMLQEAGYRQRKERRELVLMDSENKVEFFYLRPRDIAVYVGSGRLDLGITGRDLLLDSGAPAEEIMQLGFGASTLRYATRPGTVSDVSEFGGLSIATSFAGVVRRHLAEHQVDASVVHLDGAVETAIQLGVAEVIADVVETGTTLRNAGLEVIGEPVLESEAVVIRRQGDTGNEPRVQQFLRRLQGVLVARRYVMMDYDIRAELVDKAVSLTPGLESPTVSPLHDQGWVAVRSMVPVSEAQRVMDELYDLGARAILTTGIHAARL
ncbi:ATP phosphoribosyltransferase [Streptomyces sp. 7-21]|jgi:ATP phosphoribosyltransferase|uniref:ATP phosphoribosyltransferase n=1 Tax=Streptomyces sp. 7-21 TaxID=2802283 RepID=UPI00191F4D83|nr:ATP phosphoribosyltransferase [Streptomyces sp. 7-21]MBL1067243.1 ATP phosphoribosyltransferase [Streptomyces sp. 7-21]